jgi:hypothetical protein
LAAGPALRADSTISEEHAHAWSANLGWTDWYADGANGVQISPTLCSGFVYSGNVGWISLGSGVPANGLRYQNDSASDFGVNVDAAGNLRGYAYGANIGWLAFDTAGAPRVDLFTGRLSGSVYGANVGWISLSNAVGYVQTEIIAPGSDTDGDGMPDAWERRWTPDLTTLKANQDADSDGFLDQEEYVTDTNPLNPLERLEFVHVSATPGASQVTLIWRSSPTRLYQVERRSAFSPEAPWTDIGQSLVQPDPGPTTTRTLAEPGSTARFYRVRAVRPLAF